MAMATIRLRSWVSNRSGSGSGIRDHGNYNDNTPREEEPAAATTEAATTAAAGLRLLTNPIQRCGFPYCPIRIIKYATCVGVCRYMAIDFPSIWWPRRWDAMQSGTFQSALIFRQETTNCVNNTILVGGLPCGVLDSSISIKMRCVHFLGCQKALNMDVF
mmetsp:Transcript_4132/g.9003  ORF Transcript_4132/g.9003 Transcript_4132/m.9003 type:complete len:160 (+) Transcript_4132:774-1253(+)